MENKKYTKKFKFLEHTADVKFQAFGKNLEEVFENSALALKEIIVGKLKIKKEIKKKLEVTGKDNGSLLYNFLEEFLFLLDSEDFILSSIKNIKIKDDKLTAVIVGDKASNYKFTNDVKAITYHQMKVEKKIIKGKESWVCQVVVDV